MTKKLFLCILLMSAVISMAYGQGIKISGTVKDATGEPLIGVSVQVKGTPSGVFTDIDGNYAISDVPGSSTLVFSYVGMTTQEIKVANQKVINVVMKDDSKTLDEVVVIGYGTTTKRKMVGSVSSINSEKLEKTTFSNVQNALQGQVPGLIIQNSGAGVNDVPTVSIRGAGTPLFVIDGVISDEFSFTTLNPEDIESMSFLKDASATAVYGSKAGNGIVLIQTKKGKAGKPSVKYSGMLQFGQPTVIPERLTGLEYANLSNEVYEREEGSRLYDDTVLSQIGKSYLYPDNNWTDLAYKDFSVEQKHGVTLNGGGDNTQYFISLSNLNNNGILKDNATTLDRTTFRSNISSDFKKIGLKIQTGLSATIQNTREPYNPDWKKLLYYMSPLEMGYNPDGTLSSADRNPLQYFVKDAGYKKNRKAYLNAQASLTWNPTFVKGLLLGFMANYADNSYFKKEWNRQPLRYTWNPDLNESELYTNPESPSLLSNSGYSKKLDLEARIGYTRTFGQHTVDALLLYTQSTGYSDFVSAMRKGYKSELIDQISVGPLEGMSSDGTAAESGSAGYVARLKYDYASRYIIELSGRYDGNDNFAPGYRWGFFPAASLAWIISDEPFMKSLNERNILNLFKFRTSYGSTGISTGVNRFGYISAYTQATWSPDYYNVNNSLVAGYKEGALVDPSSLSWYTRKSFNIGFDFASLGNRLEGSFDYFFYTTTGYLCSPKNVYSTTLGASLPQVKSNTEHRRAGVELNLRYKNSIGQFKFEIGGNISYYNQLYKQLDTESMVDLMNPYTRLTHQKDYYAIMYKSDGLFQTPEDILNSAMPLASTSTTCGDIKYKDVNGDGKIDDSDKRRIEKTREPHVNYGIDFKLSYKNWSLSGLIQGTGTRYTYLGYVFARGDYQNAVLKYQADYWRPDNRDARFAVIHTSISANGGNNCILSDYYMADAKYLRLKTLQLSYNLKNALLKKVSFIKGCNITLAGTNLLTFSPVKDIMDPEAVLVTDGELSGTWTIPGGGFPMNRTYSIGINVEF